MAVVVMVLDADGLALSVVTLVVPLVMIGIGSGMPYP